MNIDVRQLPKARLDFISPMLARRVHELPSGTTGFEYLLVGYYEGRDLIFIAKIRNGFTPALRLEIAKNFSKLRTPACPFTNLPEPVSARRGEAITRDVMKKIVWLRPKRGAQMEFTEGSTG